MSRFRLDVSTVLALVDQQHQFHRAVNAWARRAPDSRWLTCPIVQNGAVRIASQPAYSRRLGGPEAVRRVMQAFRAHPRHEFCPDDISLLDDEHIVRPDLLTPKAVTDVYLLALARHHGARLATFDRKIVSDAVRGGYDALEVIDA